MSVTAPDPNPALAPKTFWEPKGYLSISRRTAHGYDLCEQFGDGLNDLGSVIHQFSKGLQGWSQTWRTKIGNV